jgi:hypothetical protein
MVARSSLLFLELNEINFDYVQAYIEAGKLPNMASFLSAASLASTVSEHAHEDLEPWIQWVTAHTGLTLAEHGVFRLGDIVDHDHEQIWERLQARGLTVGAVSPMNAKLRSKDMAFFVPDPWTRTGLVASPLVKKLFRAIAQAVNDNASQKITLASAFWLVIGWLGILNARNMPVYLRYLSFLPNRPWYKAIILDRILFDIFCSVSRESRVDFATLFLNAGAHIQHHYMFSSGVYTGEFRNPGWYVSPNLDPVLDVYSAYDEMIEEIRNRFPDARLMIATGLHQDPHPGLTFYWRLKDHAAFLREAGLPFASVTPLMSRDFLVRCSGPEEAAQLERVLKSATAGQGTPLFEVDNRGSDVFVMLTYPHDIRDDTDFSIGGKTISGLRDRVSFVAIKNGQHNGIGYFADSGSDLPTRGHVFPLSDLPSVIERALGLERVTSELPRTRQLSPPALAD